MYIYIHIHVYISLSVLPRLKTADSLVLETANLNMWELRWDGGGKVGDLTPVAGPFLQVEI